MPEDKTNKPQCIGIIMDGNRRWAKKKGLTSFEGHTAGYKKLEEVVPWLKEEGVKTLIAYAFSTENWKRDEDEKNYLFKLLNIFLTKEKEKLKKNKIRVKFIGQIDRFSEDIQKNIRALEEETKDFSDFNLLLALSYGGRAEILSAVNKLIKKGDEVNEETFSKNLWSAGFPDPDLIIRTSGEQRTSGFLPWQAVYSELFFTKTYWPDFSKEEFNSILADFSSRERRIGK